MDSNWISSPSDFQHMNGLQSIDSKRRFALDGTGNDETLRLYLRKAGLSDEIEYLTPEERRAFIYDIIKSNKMPGYWMQPSTLIPSSLYNSVPSTPSPAPLTQDHNSAMLSRKELASQKVKVNYISSSSNSHSDLEKSSPLFPRRFEPPPNTPSLPSSFVTGSKGRKYEISGPMNFQHMAGEMTCERTRNAFDLSLTTNDIVLNKYIIEHGIKKDDLIGMRKKDVIKNIVQSKFTWMPPNLNDNNPNVQSLAKIAYETKNYKRNQPKSTIGTKTSRSRATMYAPPTPPPPAASNEGNTVRSKSSLHILVTSFADPSEFPFVEEIYSNNGTDSPPSANIIYDSKFSVLDRSIESLESLNELAICEKDADDSTYVKATAGRTNASLSEELSAPEYIKENIYGMIKRPDIILKSTITHTKKFHKVPPQADVPTPYSNFPSPPSPLGISYNDHVKPIIPPISINKNGVSPPSPTLPNTTEKISNVHILDEITDTRNALLESIRNGVTLKKVDQRPSTIGINKPRTEPKPQVNDFLSELKLGVTLRRIKNPNVGKHPDASQT